MKYYILDEDRRPVRASLLVWAEWFENDTNRLVGWTQITSDVLVSTIFMGLDHRFLGGGPPLLFETMIFGGPLHQQMWRYSSWDDAETGHAVAVRMARNVTPDKAPQTSADT